MPSKLIGSFKTLSLFLLIASALVMFGPRPAQAQWPPFNLRLVPTFEGKKITYTVDFRSEFEGNMTDVTINIPLPEGTRFLEGRAPASTTVTFNGKEVTLFTAILSDKGIKDAAFDLEIIDPNRTKFTVHAWVAWKGDQPGDFLTSDFTLDTTLKALDWQPPEIPSLGLDLSATVEGDIITFKIYPVNQRAPGRMWDLKINVPLPAGTTFVSVEAPPQFSANNYGQEVSFTALEMPWRERFEPLILKVARDAATSFPVTTHAWATWKISNKRAGVTIDSEEQMVSGEVIVQAPIAQKIVSDPAGDMPFANYDLTNISLQNDKDTLRVTFHTAGSLCPVDAKLDFSFFINSDCNTGTGSKQERGVEFDMREGPNVARVVAPAYDRDRGVEYQVSYDFAAKRGTLRAWNHETDSWERRQKLEIADLAGGNMVTLLVPFELISDTRQFCWAGRGRSTTDIYLSNPPTDWIPSGSQPDLGLYTAYPVTTTTRLSATVVTGPASTTTNLCGQAAGPATPVISFAELKGKLAVPLLADTGQYDVHVFAIPEGRELSKISNARQPDFRFDGQKLLVNRQGGDADDIFEVDLASAVQEKVSNAPRDSHPVYDPLGNRVAYGNPELTVGSDGKRHPFIFVQCSLLPPFKETDARCKNLTSQGVLVPAGQTGDLQGSNPVWTADDQIGYKGCNTWAGGTLCGIFTVPAASSKGFSNGFIPRQLTFNTSDIPADTAAGFITFTSQRPGNWEAYVIDLNGKGLRNLSNSPASNDGLPAISPDGGWVAFVSDRGGQWAVWATPILGGEVHKLFDLPDPTPWGSGELDWMNERLSWAP
jgi:hypothetical protein